MTVHLKTAATTLCSPHRYHRPHGYLFTESVSATQDGDIVAATVCYFKRTRADITIPVSSLLTIFFEKRAVSDLVPGSMKA
jgi:hypothetical protein